MSGKMSDKKNIDRLFQEKFKDFNPTPDDQLWSKIEEKLNAEEKESKKVIPFWWRLGGVAATLALIITLSYNLFKGNTDTLPQQEIITDTKKDSKPLIDQLDPSEGLGNANANSVQEEENQENKKQDNSNPFNSYKNTTRTVANQTKNNGVLKKEKKEEEKIAPENNDSRIAVLNNDEKDSSNSKKSSSELSESKKEEGKLIAKNDNNRKDNNDALIKKDIINNESNNAVASEEEKLDDNKITLAEAVAEQKRLKEETILFEEDRLRKKWSINPSVAPVFFSSLNNGSPVSSQFTDNVKSGNINFSYGINVAYQVTKRLSIRSGINKVNYGYDTNNLTVTENTNAGASAQILPAENNITLNSSSSNIVISDAQNNSSNDQLLFSNALFFAPSEESEAVLTQELGYIEVPLELKYRLIDKKIGVNVIGGVSSLFLTDNAIVIQSENFNSEIGEADNLNSTNFSTNLGIGIDYQFSKQIQFNIEPVFKYQLNTFSGDSRNFRPYTFGVYTGFSFRF